MQMRVDQQVISGNQDFPEGGLDGFLQAIVCKKVCTKPIIVTFRLTFMPNNFIMWHVDIISDGWLEKYIS